MEILSTFGQILTDKGSSGHYGINFFIVLQTSKMGQLG